MWSLLPILLGTVLIVMFSMSAVLIWRYTERNRLQKTLVVVLVLWILMFLGLELNLIRVYDGQNLPTSGMLNFHNIILGLIGQFSLLSYAAVAIHPRLIAWKNSLLFLSPVLLVLAIYMVWHLVTGTPMNHRYLTMEELWAARGTFPVLLRTLMLLFFCIYLFINLRNIWLLVPIYNRYSESVYSDMDYNVKWLRIVVISTGAICIAYLIVLIWNYPLSLVVYTLVTCGCLAMLTDNAVFHKVFQEPEDFKVEWSFRKGWHEVCRPQKPTLREEESPTDEPNGLQSMEVGQPDKQEPDIETALEEWMSSEKPFCRPDFSFKDVTGKFPSLDYHTLTEIMERRNHTFQSYVRQHRIEEACRLMRQPKTEITANDISLQVGFSRYTSFNRAFVIVMNESPSQYREKVMQKE